VAGLPAVLLAYDVKSRISSQDYPHWPTEARTHALKTRDAQVLC